MKKKNKVKIKQSESISMEFKVKLPKRSEKYIKTVVAFANTSGDKIIIGADDTTQTVVGVEN